MKQSNQRFKLNSVHWEYFKSCFPRPVKQGVIGLKPARYIEEIHAFRQGNFDQLFGIGHHALKREEIKEDWARNQKRHVLASYAAVMAWGGRNFHNYRMSLTGSSGDHLEDLLISLQTSIKNRKDDFADTQKQCQKINGLGISFYTKLLFFFREQSDAYILDQWTAKSVNLLFNDCPIRLTTLGMPHSETTPKNYEWFCSCLEFLGTQLSPEKPWTGTLVEPCVFDNPSGAWRSYVRSYFFKETWRSYVRTFFSEGKFIPKVTLLPKVKSSSKSKLESENHRLKVALGETIKIAHNAAMAKEVSLPGSRASLQRSNAVRVNCGVLRGLNWQYDIQMSIIHAKVFVAKSQIEHTQKALTKVDTTGLDIRFNGSGSIRISIERGANEPETEWHNIASEAVDAMNQLFERLSEVV